MLYEILSGKRAFTAPTLAALRDEKEQSTPTAPSELRSGIDPIVERLVMRCLERDPRSRPASVAQLAAALPGGDPLAAALAAGETPSPELVAASGLKEGLRPAVAIALLAFIVAGSLIAVAMNRRSMLIERLPPGKPPAFLVEHAREIIRKAGYVDEPADFAYGFDYDADLIRYFESTDKSADRWNHLQALEPMTFWYRQSARPLERFPLVSWSTVTENNPPPQIPGEVLVGLDPQGRLKRFDAIPPRPRSAAGLRPFDSTLLQASILRRGRRPSRDRIPRHSRTLNRRGRARSQRPREFHCRSRPLTVAELLPSTSSAPGRCGCGRASAACQRCCHRLDFDRRRVGDHERKSVLCSPQPSTGPRRSEGRSATDALRVRWEHNPLGTRRAPRGDAMGGPPVLYRVEWSAVLHGPDRCALHRGRAVRASPVAARARVVDARGPGLVARPAYRPRRAAWMRGRHRRDVLDPARDHRPFVVRVSRGESRRAGGGQPPRPAPSSTYW